MLGYRCTRIVAIPKTLLASYPKIITKYLGSACAGGKGDGDSGDQNCCPCPSCNCCPCNCHPGSVYDCRKYGHCLPGYNVRPNFPVLPCFPTGIFRCTSEECLGPQGQAGKCCMYRNPEYFSFHHMTYYDMHLLLRCFRNPCPVTNRKPT